MDQAQVIKKVGELCPDCGTPYIMGKKGVYCKNCYIKWAEKNKLQNQAPQQEPTYEQEKQERIDKAVKIKNENINWSNAKNNATLVVTSMNIYRMKTEPNDIKNAIMEWANWFYNQEPAPFE